MELDEIDRKGLIRESYRIEGIGPEECRSIFLDWAISAPADADTKAQIRILLETYGGNAPDHPMTAVLRAGLEAAPATGRRGGRSGRRR